MVGLGELEDEPAVAEVSAAWSEAGLVFVAKVSAKKQPIWCRASRAEDSDALQVWIDTRDVHNVHRASRFCHRFIFLPSGGGKKLDEAFGQSLPINRAPRAGPARRGGRVESRWPCPTRRLRAGVFHSRRGHDRLRAGGASPHRVYLCLDRPRIRPATFSIGPPMPYDEDPSLWATLELVGKGD